MQLSAQTVHLILGRESRWPQAGFSIEERDAIPSCCLWHTSTGGVSLEDLLLQLKLCAPDPQIWLGLHAGNLLPPVMR